MTIGVDCFNISENNPIVGVCPQSVSQKRLEDSETENNDLKISSSEKTEKQKSRRFRFWKWMNKRR